MHCIRLLKYAASALLLALVLPSSSSAQVGGRPYVSGLTHPVAFVQDPANAGVQFVVERGGTIRVIQGGALLSTPFLDLTGIVSPEVGERGLLSLAFAPGQSGRFFVTFVDRAGNTVVSRFYRSADPLIADPGSRFDLQWSTGNRYIVHPEIYHYGGSLVFGADGYLYIALGDGGEPDDASHQAQDMSKLHGKMLRINVNVADSDPEGLDIPGDNPFAGGSVPEIWSVGFRNPWKFTLDDPQRGGTGAFLVADVGENAVEEIDYEPAGRGGRNYGWRNREGHTGHDSSLPPAFGPLTDPIFDYGHDVGKSITGGYVYRGAAIPAMAGRYVFGDFVRGRIWSVALTVDGSGEASASDLREHTAEIGSGVRMISAFGVDASGELFVVNYADGTIVAITPSASTPHPPAAPAPLVQIDLPSPGAHVRQPFIVSGWALDATAADAGIGALHVWAFPLSGAAPQFLGLANYGIGRPDVAAFFGPQFGATGYNVLVKGLASGEWVIAVYGWVNATQTFAAVNSVLVTIDPATLLNVDTPQSGATVGSPFFLAGWAADPGAAAGTGIDTIHVWAFSSDGTAAPRFVGVPLFVDRPDVAAYLGPQFRHAGFNMGVAGLTSGNWDIYVFAHSSVSNAFDNTQIVRVKIP
jgi:glucose/arabinose dehydrogenase